jgi:hypothetical protein
MLDFQGNERAAGRRAAACAVGRSRCGGATGASQAGRVVGGLLPRAAFAGVRGSERVFPGSPRWRGAGSAAAARGVTAGLRVKVFRPARNDKVDAHRAAGPRALAALCGAPG